MIRLRQLFIYESEMDDKYESETMIQCEKLRDTVIKMFTLANFKVIDDYYEDGDSIYDLCLNMIKKNDICDIDVNSIIISKNSISKQVNYLRMIKLAKQYIQDMKYDSVLVLLEYAKKYYEDNSLNNYRLSSIDIENIVVSSNLEKFMVAYLYFSKRRGNYELINVLHRIYYLNKDVILGLNDLLYEVGGYLAVRDYKKYGDKINYNLLISYTLSDRVFNLLRKGYVDKYKYIRRKY
jgi:hypothetical protein